MSSLVHFYMMRQWWHLLHEDWVCPDAQSAVEIYVISLLFKKQFTPTKNEHQPKATVSAENLLYQLENSD